MIRRHLAFTAGLALAVIQSPSRAQPTPASAPTTAAPSAAQPAPAAAEDGRAPANADEAWTGGNEPTDAAAPATTEGTPPAAAAAPGAAPTPASAVATQAPTATLEQPEPAAAVRGLGGHQRHFGLAVGLRTSFIPNEAFDPFAEKDTLVQFSAALGGALIASERSSLAVFLGYEGGGREASARGERTELDVHRVLIAPELRRHLWPTFYVYARPAVGATHLRAALFDSSSGANMVAKGWGVSFDASAGAAFELLGNTSGARTGVRAWVLAEGGYGVGSKFPLEMKPDGDSPPARAEAIDLGDLPLSGPFFKLMLALTY